MAAGKSKQLVIDASIARAAGGDDATFPLSIYCRNLLLAVLEICHHLVLTDEIKEEWDTQQSNFAREWRLSMFARRKVARPETETDEGLWEKILETADTENQEEAIEKDLRLVEAALVTDQIVLSLDEKMRALLNQAAKTVGELRNLMWANPGNEDEDLIVWLEKGAKTEKPRKLGQS